MAKTATAPAAERETQSLDFHPAIAELVALLPAPDAEFPLAKRLLWLRAAAAIFDLVYGHDPERVLAITPDAQ